MTKQEVMQKLAVGILTALISAYIWKRING
ncbi:hypothetical protein H334_19995 [Vibrio parahaemolyticus 901128]|jgi:hypothetical protein|nr:hypothetical protein H334_19995 [Vibrio parahaemolyticus 901128]